MKALLCLLAASALAPSTDLADFFNTDAGPVKVTPVFASTLILAGRGKVIYIDPIASANYKGLPKADLILITSNRPGHLDPDAIAKISRKQTAIVAPSAIAAKFPQSTSMANGESISAGDVSIEAVPAFGLDKQERGQANGYVVTFPGLRVYVSGDTAPFPEMKNLKNIEVAFLAAGGPDTMTLEQGAEAIHLFKPKTVYPYHFGKANPDDLRKQLAAPGTEIRIRHWD